MYLLLEKCSSFSFTFLTENATIRVLVAYGVRDNVRDVKNVRDGVKAVETMKRAIQLPAESLYAVFSPCTLEFFLHRKLRRPLPK